jgi:hypothetical protein
MVLAASCQGVPLGGCCLDMAEQRWAGSGGVPAGDPIRWLELSGGLTWTFPEAAAATAARPAMAAR